MKLFKKIILPLVAGVCAIAAFASFMACTDEPENSTDSSSVTESSNTAESSTSENIKDKYTSEDDATGWDYTTYVVYLQLPDGTPVANVGVQICSDVNCLDGTTNEDGRVSVSFPSSQQSNTVYMHFPTSIDDNLNVIEYEGPDGYTLPEGSTEYEGYSHAWILTEKVTTLTFVAE